MESTELQAKIAALMDQAEASAVIRALVDYLEQEAATLADSASREQYQQAMELLEQAANELDY